MTLSDLLHSLTTQGVILVCVGCDAIEARGPVNSLSPEQRQALRQHKPTLLQMLQPPAAEPFPDGVMQALREVDFDGVIIADHIPVMGDDPRLSTAFTLGYMKSMLDQRTST